MNDRLVPAPLGEDREAVDLVRTLSSQSSHGSVHNSIDGAAADGTPFQNSRSESFVPGCRRSLQEDIGKQSAEQAQHPEAAAAALVSSAPTPSSSWEASTRSADEHAHVQSQTNSNMAKSCRGDDPPILVREDSAEREDAHDDDDEEEEEEMVSLEQQRILLQQRQQMAAGAGAAAGGGGPNDVGAPPHLRRTPGANAMHRSAFLRRTPGASAMHRSAASATKGGMTTSASVGGARGGGQRGAAAPAPLLGFGLTLSTPVGSRSPENGKEAIVGTGKDPKNGSGGVVALSYTSSGSSDDHGSVTPVATGGGAGPSSAARPPLDPSIGRQNFVYTPAGLSLAKNPHLAARDAFSPNTIRLTESLDHLLHEEEEDVELGPAERKEKHVVGSTDGQSNSQAQLCKPVSVKVKSAEAEDWSESYTFNQDNAGQKQEPAVIARNSGKIGGTKSPSTVTRKGRRNRSSPRGSPRTSGGDAMANSADGRPLQPNAQIESKAAALNRLGSPDPGFHSSSSGADADERPGPLNFDPSGVGAFAPPSKTKAGPYQPQPGTSFHTPTPKKPQRDQPRAPGAAGQYQQPQPQNHHGSAGPTQPFVGPHHPQPYPLHYGNDMSTGHHKLTNDSYFVPHQVGPDHPVPFAPQQQHPHGAAPAGHIHDRSFAPSPHHFDYVTPHPYGGGHPHVHMISPINVPPVSPMTIPSYPPVEQQQLHASHAGGHHHSTQNLPHHGGMQHQYPGMGSIPHVQQPGPPSWSPPTLPPYAMGAGGTQRNDGGVGWQQPTQGGGMDVGVGWSAYGGGNNLPPSTLPPPPPPPPHPMGHMSPTPPGSPYTIPSWSDYSDYNGSIGMGMGIVNPSGGSISHQASEAPNLLRIAHQQQTHERMGHQHRNMAEYPQPMLGDHSGHADFGQEVENAYPSQQRAYPNQPVRRQKQYQPSDDFLSQRQSQARGRVPCSSKQSKQASRKQRGDSDSMNGHSLPPSHKSSLNKSLSNARAEELNEMPQQQRRSDKRETNGLAPQSLQRKKSTSESPKKKKMQQPGPENAPPQLPTTKSEDTIDTPGAGTDVDAPSAEVTASAGPKHAAELKRAELIESPAVRAAFKDFYRKFRLKERSSFTEAEEYALLCLGADGSGDGSESFVLPLQVHWRVHLELADLAKRANKFDEARRLYRKVCTMQPFASQGWLEYSKLEEESGELEKCAGLLNEGLSYCEYNESLLTRAIKHQERTGDLNRARQLLARLKHVGIEKVWRTVLEGALLEARAGNVAMARRVLKYLMHHVPWYGPLYLEAYRLERDADRPLDALVIVERGLGEIPRYGPLWFGAFRLCEGLDVAEGSLDLPRTTRMLERAAESISRELLWKVHLEAAQAHERAALLAVANDRKLSIDEQLGQCRRSFAKTVLACPPSLCWKVWLAGGRMELSAGRTDEARRLFLRAHDVVPEKGRAAVLLECARLEEFAGDIELARAILCRARFDAGSDWKVWLESIFLETRCGKRIRAINLARCALQVHSGTGRLWAALVQLRQPDGEAAQTDALKRALRAVPKSGEVWCEGARLHLNPFLPTFDLQTAWLHLDFATKFTPQYGDSFLETLRLELLTKWISPVAAYFIEQMEQRIAGEVSSDSMDPSVVWKVVEQCTRNAAEMILTFQSNEPCSSSESKRASTKSSSTVAAFDEDHVKDIDTSDLELRCSNADPNYGKMWFHCRILPSDTARHVIRRAKTMLACDIAKSAHLYVAAMVRRAGIALCLKQEMKDAAQTAASADAGNDKGKSSCLPVFIEGSSKWDKLLESRLRAAPCINHLLFHGGNENTEKLMESRPAFSGSDFITGITELNRHKPLESLSLIQRRRTLFGSDLVLSWKPA